MSALSEAVAKAIYNAFQKANTRGGYVGEYRFAGGAETCLDGDFDLEVVALEAIRAMAEVEPSQDMVDILHDDESIARYRYRAMLRQAVAEAEKGRET